MQRRVECAISATPRPWRKHYAKHFKAKGVSLTHTESQDSDGTKAS
jgi:hypothetical protein